MALDFDAIMNKVADTVERPPLAPLGDYVFKVDKLPDPPRDLKSEKGEWKVVEFPMSGVRATDEVDADMLKAYGEPKNIRVRKSFLFDVNDAAAAAQTEYNMKEFLTKHLGLDGSMTLKEQVNASVGQQCIGALRYRADANDKSVQYHDLGRTAPLA